jgi:outer membrane receptor protein involved in Fe transport
MQSQLPRGGRDGPRTYGATSAPAGTYGNYGFSANQSGQPYLKHVDDQRQLDRIPLRQFLLGAANSGSISNFQDGQWRKHNFGFYVQDTWKFNRRLTLDYGIRWDYQTAYKELYSRNSEFAPNTPNPSAGGLLGATQYEGYGPKRCNCDFTNTYPYAIGPRLGVAYQIAPKTVLRAGWGFVYGTTAVVNYQLGGALGTGFNTLQFTNPGFGQPALALQNGLHYNTADLYAATLDPGIRPTAGQINSPWRL